MRAIAKVTVKVCSIISLLIKEGLGEGFYSKISHVISMAYIFLITHNSQLYFVIPV